MSGLSRTGHYVESVSCPCCGQPVQRPNPLKLIEHLPLAGSFRIVALRLARDFGKTVLIDVLEQELYGGVHNGGPADARGSLRQLAYQLRLRLKPHGLTIEGQGGRGRNGTWRMGWTA